MDTPDLGSKLSRESRDQGVERAGRSGKPKLLRFDRPEPVARGLGCTGISVLFVAGMKGKAVLSLRNLHPKEIESV